MKGYVYAIKADSGTRYIGSTQSVIKRLQYHNLGKSSFTKKFKNWKLLGYLEFNSIKEARLYERKIKKHQSERDRFYKLITGSSSIG